MRLITFCEVLQIGFYFILKRPASELKFEPKLLNSIIID